MGHLREQAFRSHYDCIYRYLRRRRHDNHEADELAQTVFVEAAARLDDLRHGATPVLAWLYTRSRSAGWPIVPAPRLVETR